MASILPIPTLLQVADISQYLAANDISICKRLKSAYLAPALSLQIFAAKTVVRWVYNLNQNDPSLVQTGNYLYQLLGSYALAAQNILTAVASGPPTISNPFNQSVPAGQNATFSVTVTSVGSYTIQWYRNGMPITGATSVSYTLTNAQLTDSGATFYAVATNVAGSVASGIATLTVTASITAYLSYGDVDPDTALQSGNDPFTYQVSLNVVHNTPISVPLPSASTPNKFLIIKVPIAEQIDNTWFNTNENFGTIPDSVFRAYVQFGGWTYYYTRNASTMDTTQPLILSAV